MHDLSTTGSRPRACHLLRASGRCSEVPLGSPSQAHCALTHCTRRTRRAAPTCAVDATAHPRHHRSWSRPTRTSGCRRRRRRQDQEKTGTKPPRSATADVYTTLPSAARQCSHRHRCYLRRLLVPARSSSHVRRVRTQRSITCNAVRIAARVRAFRFECCRVLGAESARSHVRLRGVETAPAQGSRGTAFFD